MRPPLPAPTAPRARRKAPPPRPRAVQTSGTSARDLQSSVSIFSVWRHGTIQPEPGSVRGSVAPCRSIRMAPDCAARSMRYVVGELLLAGENDGRTRYDPIPEESPELLGRSKIGPTARRDLRDRERAGRLVQDLALEVPREESLVEAAHRVELVVRLDHPLSAVADEVGNGRGEQREERRRGPDRDPRVDERPAVDEPVGRADVLLRDEARDVTDP